MPTSSVLYPLQNGFQFRIIKENDSDNMTVVIKTPEGRQFQIKKFSLGDNELNLNNIDQESFAEKVAELVTQLLEENPIEHNEKKIRLTARLKNEKISGKKVSNGRVKNKIQVKDPDDTTKVFKEVKKRARQVFSGKDGVKLVEDSVNQPKPSKMRNRALQIGGLFAAGLAIPVLGPLALMVKGGYALKTKVEKWQGSAPIRDLAQEVKKQESQVRFETLSRDFQSLDVDLEHKPSQVETEKAEFQSAIEEYITEESLGLLQKKLKDRIAVCVLRSKYPTEKYDTILTSFYHAIMITPPGIHNFDSVNDLRAYIRELSNMHGVDIPSFMSNQDLKDIVKETELLCGSRKNKKVA